jgi:NAD-dependent SIR2 family protein deacetylase
MDLLDGAVNCSREINGHASLHAQDTSHALTVSFSDLSVWCYACDSYITSPLLSGMLQSLSDAKHSNPLSPSQLCASPPKLKAFADAFATARNIMIVMGAGASTSAGIPDFRTPGSGLYDNLQAYGLPSPEAVFSIDFFRSNPVPFNMLIRDLLPGAHKPTPSHAFLKMLNDQNKLLRVYSQNIDGLETLAGLPEMRVVQCHGGFGSAHCIECNTPYSMDLIRECCKQNAHCTPDGASSADHTGPAIPCCDCGGLVKPQITFFGEALPNTFAQTVVEDLMACDCLIVIGTSLKVMPVARLPSLVSSGVPRMVINRDAVGEEQGMFSRDGDAFMQGTCDDGVLALCNLSGLAQEFAHAVSYIDSQFKPSLSSTAAASSTQQVSFSMQM